MCYHPITIPSPKRCYASGIDAHWLQVPCGHCPDCQRVQKNEWYVRIYAEYLRVKKTHGCVAMPTLTYDDEHVPHFKDNGFDFKCFNKVHVQMFIKKLRIYLKRSGIDTSFTYLICSEYGKNATKRPHYHPLLFFNKFVPYPVLMPLINKAWIHGRVGISKKGLFIRGIAGCKYASKYIVKDLGFFDTEDCAPDAIENGYGCPTTLHDYLYNLSADDSKKTKLNRVRRDKMREAKALPFHLSSTHFGFNLYDILGFGKDDMQTIKDRLLKGTVRLPLETTDYPIPRYLLRNVFKKKEGDLWLSTDLYLDIVDDCFKKMYDAQYNELYTIINSDNYKSFVPFDLLPDFEGSLKLLRQCDLSKLLKYTFIRNLDILELPVYHNSKVPIGTSQMDMYNLYQKFFVLKRLQCQNLAPDIGESAYKLDDFRRRMCYKDMPFNVYNELLFNALVFVQEITSNARESAYVHNQGLKELLRHKVSLNNTIYPYEHFLSA